MKPYHREMGREGKVLNLDRGFIFHIPPFKFVIIQQKKQKKQEDWKHFTQDLQLKMVF